MRLQSFHCPSCAAQLDIKPGASRVRCAYCGGTLVVEGNAVTSEGGRRPGEAEEDKPEYPEPGATLYTREAARFEMSVIEQRIFEAVRDRFTHLELGDDRFALVWLRLVDAKGAPVEGDLETPFRALRESLETDGDPGLAANLALDSLGRSFSNRLEAAVAMFEPRHMTVVTYNSGCPQSLWWVSHEEGRCMTVDTPHDALERKFLRENRDYFSNGRTVHLASGDLLVMVSAGFAGRGGKGMWPSGSGVLTEVLNGHLGEDPLRVVTLAKNEFWSRRSKHRDGDGPPCGDVKIAAVRAIPPPMATAVPGGGAIETLRSRKYELAFVRGPQDRVEHLPLHGDRSAIVWMSPKRGGLPDGAFPAAAKAVREVLDGAKGDSDEPRQAGKEALEAMRLDPDAFALAVILTLDVHGRVKYWRHGWRHAIALGDRGIKSDYGMQQWGEGGDATLHRGARLFFPGPLAYEGEYHSAEALGQVWWGGKASRLYEALCDHWKTRRSEKVLEKLVLAAASDAKVESAVGMAVVTALQG